MLICTSAKQKDCPSPKPSIIPSPSLWSFPLHLVHAFSPKAVSLTFPLHHSCYRTRSYLTCRGGYTISGWWFQWCLSPHPWQHYLKRYPQWSLDDPKHGGMGFQMLCAFPGLYLRKLLPSVADEAIQKGQSILNTKRVVRCRCGISSFAYLVSGHCFQCLFIISAILRTLLKLNFNCMTRMALYHGLRCQS